MQLCTPASWDFSDQIKPGKVGRRLYKILIVDDEKIERNGIKFLLKRTEIDCEITEAVNGKEALEIIEQQDIDILLTDVKMPFMDGIELIEKLVEMKKNIVSIIFSGCSEFEYAKQAVRLGVSDYILKPVDPTEFSITIDKVIDQLEENRVEESLKNKSIEYMSEHMLYLVANKADLKAVEEYNKGLLDLDFLYGFKRMMLIEFNNDFYGTKGADFKDRIKTLLPASDKYLNLNSQQSVLLFHQDDLDFLEMGNRICQFVHEIYGETCFVAVSSVINGIEGIPTGIDELDTLMENKFYHQGCNVFYTGMRMDDTAIIQIDDDTLMKQMKQDIKMKDVSGLRDHFNRFCQKYQNKTDFSQVYIKFLFSNLLKDFYDNLPETNEKDLNEEIDVLYRATDFNKVIQLVNSNIDKLETLFGQNPQMIHREIEIVKQYIYENYQNEISVEQLGDMVFMAPSYLSSIFKKETGQNLSKFIKAYRMEKAKDMLENSMSKIVDISSACGYPNVSYFCSSFREYYGVSPQKFRENGDEFTA